MEWREGTQSEGLKGGIARGVGAKAGEIIQVSRTRCEAGSGENLRHREDLQQTDTPEELVSVTTPSRAIHFNLLEK